MGHITCNHCKDTFIKEIGDGDTLVRCSSCEGYTHHRCVRRCPVLLEKKGKRFLKAAGVAVFVGVGAAVAAPLALTVAGFTSAGVAGGSIAAVVQSVVYGGATTGIFSALQSAGAVGLTAATQAAIGGAAGATAGLAKWKLS